MSSETKQGDTAGKTATTSPPETQSAPAQAAVSVLPPEHWTQVAQVRHRRPQLIARLLTGVLFRKQKMTPTQLSETTPQNRRLLSHRQF